MQRIARIEAGNPVIDEASTEKHLRYVIFCVQLVKTGENVDIHLLMTHLGRRESYPAQFPFQRTVPGGLLTEDEASLIFQKFMKWISVDGTSRGGVPKVLDYGSLDEGAIIHPLGGGDDIEGYIIGFSSLKPPESGDWSVYAGRHSISVESKKLDEIGFWDIEKGHRLALLSVLDRIKESLTDALVNAGHEVCFDECFERARERLMSQ
jgi:hypothetical protein